jgi:hypothetical protein
MAAGNFVNTRDVHHERTASSSDEDNVPKVFVSPQHGNDLDGFLGALARLYRLNVYGKSLLTRSAAFELRFIAVMLTIIFLFDFAAWSLFWDMVFYNGRLEFGFLTFLAFFLASLIALMIVIYERGFMVTDLSQLFKRWGSTVRLLSAIMLRILVIAVAAYITAQPVEIVTFRGQIENRIHETGIRREAVSRLRDLQKAEAASRLEGLAGTSQKKELDDADSVLKNVRQDEARLKGELSNAQKGEQGALASLKRAQAAYARAYNKQAAAARISAAAGRLEVARQKVADAAAQVEGHKTTVENAKTDRGAAIEKVEGLLNEAKGDATRVRDWLVQLRHEPFSLEVMRENRQGGDWTYRDEDYDLFQRQAVIDDMYHGRPPRWKDASDEDKAEIAQKFGFGESQEELERRAIEAETFRKSYWAVFLVAFMLPLLVMAYKLLLPKAITDYYSVEMQNGKFLNGQG